MRTSDRASWTREAGAEPAVSALNGEQPEGLTGRASLPPEVGVQARYERLAVTHAITLSQLPTLSIDFIDKDQGCPSPGVPSLRHPPRTPASPVAKAAFPAASSSPEPSQVPAFAYLYDDLRFFLGGFGLLGELGGL